MAKAKLPIIAVTLGDPAGIGPEIAVKTFAEKEIYEICRPVLVGSALAVERALAITHQALELHPIATVAEAKFESGTLDLIDIPMSETHTFGVVNAECGRLAYEYIESAVNLALAGEVDALATAPINKESLQAAKVPFIGHTEILAALAGVEDPLTMFEVRGLRVFFLSRHLSLRKACDAVTYDRVYDYIERCTAAMKQLGIEGTLAVAGLNPHSGEHGLFGDEEVVHVEPAVTAAREAGYDVVGPIGADSVFHQAYVGKYAAVLSLYHDQGHIATKTLDFHKTISLTNSLPFLRTSVDHGTAFDIAGQDIASPVSLIEAIRVAAKYAPSFRKIQ